MTREQHSEIRSKGVNLPRKFLRRSVDRRIDAYLNRIEGVIIG